MKFNKLSKIFLVLSFFVFMVFSVRPASADNDPAGCTLNSAGVAIGVFRADGVTPVVGTVQSGETIRYQSTLFNGPAPTFCNFSGGTLVITTPDGAVHDVTPGGGIPLVTDGGPFLSALVNYAVSEGDVSGGSLQATTQYTNGESHLGESHQQANAGPNGIAVAYEDVNVEVEKDANPSFDSECTWTIDKSVDVVQHDLTTGDSGTSNYDVLVSSDCTDTNFAATGTITVHNPALFADAIVASLDDDVSGVVATVDCTGDPSFVGFPHTLAPGETLTCTYSASLPDGDPRTNTATATTSGDVGGGEGTAQVDFTGVDPTDTTLADVTVEDTFAGALGGCNAFDEDGSCLFEYARTFTCDQDAGQHDNTATIVETGQSDSESVVVTCTPPVLGCTLTQGYWKTHSDQGPAPYDSEGWGGLGDFDGDTVNEEEAEAFYSSGKSWLQVFNTAPKGNAYYILAHQYMAAVLNAATGANVPSEVQDAMDDAAALFGTYTPAQVAAMKGNNPVRQQFVNLAGVLGDYNEGTIGPGHCTDGNSSTPTPPGGEV
ncbi:MAG TPA: hypothetical protein VI819_00560 [Patescibacteria group bacterium]|nr:hypothetical protein [Patescibacteria group bacterium]